MAVLTDTGYDRNQHVKGFGTYCISEQPQLRQDCTYTQPRQSLWGSHILSIEVDEGSDQKLDF